MTQSILNPQEQAMLDRAGAYIKSLGPIITEQAMDDIQYELAERMTHKPHNPLVCRAFNAIWTLRQENQRLRHGMYNGFKLSRDRLHVEIATVVRRMFQHMFTDSPAEKAQSQGAANAEVLPTVSGNGQASGGQSDPQVPSPTPTIPSEGKL